MDTRFAALDSKQSRYGLILEGQSQKHFDVLWMNGEITSETLATVNKVIWNSVSFFTFVDPVRNTNLAIADPLQLGLEILQERRTLSAPKMVPVARSFFLEKLSEIGVDTVETPRMFEKIKRAFKHHPELVKLLGTGYVLLSDVEVSNPVPLISPQREQTRESSQGSKDLTGSPWDEFVEILAKKVIEPSRLLSHPSAYLGSFQKIQAEYLRLSAFDKEGIVEHCRESKHPSIQLIGWMLLDGAIPTESNLSPKIQALASQVLWHHVAVASSIGSAERVALSRLIKIAITKLETRDVDFKQLLSLAEFLLSLPAPVVETLLNDVRDAAISRIRSARPTEAAGITQAIAVLQWDAFKGELLSQACLCFTSDEISPSIWSGISFSGLRAFLESQEGVKPTAGVPTSEYLNIAFESFFASTSQHEMVQSLGLLPPLLERVPAQVLAGWFEKALSNSANGRQTLENIKGSAQLAEKKLELEQEINTLSRDLLQHEQLQSILAGTKKEVLELRSINEKLRKGNAEAKRQESLQAEADAARKVVSLLTGIEEAVGSSYLNNKGVKSALKGLRIEAVCLRGEVVAFDRTKHNDPESKANPGDRVNVLSSGFTWTNGSTIVVLRKALVAM